MKYKLITKHIVDWLKTYCDNSKMNGFVVGVSGGIDSAVVSTLCAKTDYETTLAVMPTQYYMQLPQKQARNSAINHIKWLQNNYPHVTFIEINLTEPFQAFKNEMPLLDNLTLANTQSRLRMMTLYALAGSNNNLVVGTGNKVEDFGIGFYTKYGDGGVDISPIGDLMKSEVWGLGRYLGIARDIIEATPTDGLWEDNRSDENQIGATYKELEWAINWAVNKPNLLNMDNRQVEVLKIYEKFQKANQHKMQPIPVCNIPKHFKKFIEL